MKITDATAHEEILFEDLKQQDIFKFDNRLFMKVSDDAGRLNAYDFIRKTLMNLPGNTKVQYIPAELILHDKSWEYID